MKGKTCPRGRPLARCNEACARPVRTTTGRSWGLQPQGPRWSVRFLLSAPALRGVMRLWYLLECSRGTEEADSSPSPERKSSERLSNEDRVQQPKRLGRFTPGRLASCSARSSQKSVSACYPHVEEGWGSGGRALPAGTLDPLGPLPHPPFFISAAPAVALTLRGFVCGHMSPS